MNAPSTFQRMMNDFLGNLRFVKVYLDDLVTFSSSMEENLEHIREVVGVIAGHGLKIKVSKCEFTQKQVSLLGHVVDKNGVSADSKKIEVIQSTSRLSDQTELRSFLGMAGYYRRFIHGFANI